jgi:ferrous iron transport protein A
MGPLNANHSANSDCKPRHFRRILNSDHSGRIFLLPRFRARHNGVRPVSVLSELTVGERGILVSLDLPESVQNHLMHMGFVPGSCVISLRRAPAGDPTVYSVDGLEIALRHETAEAIRVRPCTAHSVAPGSNNAATAPVKADEPADAETAFAEAAR